MTTVKCRCRMSLSYVCDGDLGDLLDWRHSYLIPLYCNLDNGNNFQLMIVYFRHETPSIDKRSTCSLSLTHVLHYTALFTCERTLSTAFGTRGNSRIIISAPSCWALYSSSLTEWRNYNLITHTRTWPYQQKEITNYK